MRGQDDRVFPLHHQVTRLQQQEATMKVHMAATFTGTVQVHACQLSEPSKASNFDGQPSTVACLEKADQGKGRPPQSHPFLGWLDVDGGSGTAKARSCSSMEAPDELEVDDAMLCSLPLSLTFS